MNDLELVLFVFAVWLVLAITLLLVYQHRVRIIDAINERNQLAAAHAKDP